MSHQVSEKGSIIEIEFFEPIEPMLIWSILANAGFSPKDISIVERIE